MTTETLDQFFERAKQEIKQSNPSYDEGQIEYCAKLKLNGEVTRRHREKCAAENAAKHNREVLDDAYAHYNLQCRFVDSNEARSRAVDYYESHKI